MASGNFSHACYPTCCNDTECNCCSAARTTQARTAATPAQSETQTKTAKVMLGEALAVTGGEVAALTLLQPYGEYSTQRPGQV